MKKCIMNRSGEGTINTGIMIIIGVVVGALILGGVYLLFAGDSGILKNTEREITDLMNTENTAELKVDSGKLKYSYDGSAWFDTALPGLPADGIADPMKTVTKDGETTAWVVCVNHSGGSILYISNNGKDWTVKYTAPVSAHLGTNGSKLTWTGSDGRRYESSDGLNWLCTGTPFY